MKFVVGCLMATLAVVMGWYAAIEYLIPSSGSAASWFPAETSYVWLGAIVLLTSISAVLGWGITWAITAKNRKLLFNRIGIVALAVCVLLFLLATAGFLLMLAAEHRQVP